VGWIDSSAGFKSLGRSIVFRGNHHAKVKKEKLSFNDNYTFNLKRKFPSWIMNFITIKLLNTIYYYFNFSKKSFVKLTEYFYQLDKIKNWNLIYGNKGFISYQLVIPEKDSFKAIYQILNILLVNKCFSFVSVIKFLGKNDGYNSFGVRGFTLVFDFPIYKNIYSTLKKVNEMVIRFKGRVYLCKDSTLNEKQFKQMNTGFHNKEFIQIRKNKKKYFNSEQSQRLKI